jgi:hypothetical protein
MPQFDYDIRTIEKSEEVLITLKTWGASGWQVVNIDTYTRIITIYPPSDAMQTNPFQKSILITNVILMRQI